MFRKLLKRILHWITKDDYNEWSKEPSCTPRLRLRGSNENLLSDAGAFCFTLLYSMQQAEK